MKKIIKSLLLILCFSLTTACKQDVFEDVDIFTTIYPMEYIVDYLYGEHSNINSIYPSGVDVREYQLNEKQIKDYSKTSLFIFDGTTSEKEYVAKFFKYNKGLKIIDATASMEAIYDTDELWLNPSNFLMMAQNIRYGLKEYINNHYLKTEIDEKYNKLKGQISKIDADLYDLGSKTSNKTIVASSNLFKFLEKYGLEVISLEENEDLTEKTILTVIEKIHNGEIHYIFMKDNEDISSTVQRVIDKTNVEIARFHTIANLTGEERNAKKDYMTIMSDNIDLLRNELYE